MERTQREDRSIPLTAPSSPQFPKERAGWFLPLPSVLTSQPGDLTATTARSRALTSGHRSEIHFDGLSPSLERAPSGLLRVARADLAAGFNIDGEGPLAVDRTHDAVVNRWRCQSILVIHEARAPEGHRAFDIGARSCCEPPFAKSRKRVPY
jgi:hypothetical protein